jgi:hypothetical protein
VSPLQEPLEYDRTAAVPDIVGGAVLAGSAKRPGCSAMSIPDVVPGPRTDKRSFGFGERGLIAVELRQIGAGLSVELNPVLAVQPKNGVFTVGVCGTALTIISHDFARAGADIFDSFASHGIRHPADHPFVRGAAIYEMAVGSSLLHLGSLLLNETHDYYLGALRAGSEFEDLKARAETPVIGAEQSAPSGVQLDLYHLC